LFKKDGKKQGDGLEKDAGNVVLGYIIENGFLCVIITQTNPGFYIAS